MLKSVMVEVSRLACEGCLQVNNICTQFKNVCIMQELA